jgi:hypothetical protein
MNCRIERMQITNGRLDPVEAELWVHVDLEHATSNVQLRGRLIGPRCPYSSTVEVAYPFQELVQEGAHRRLRAIIPEPCWWDPETPFLYEGLVELWHAGQRCDQIPIRHGLRRFHLAPQGLRWNGRLLTLQGSVRSSCQPDDALRLHRAGTNLLIVPVAAGNAALWEIADRFGFLVLGQVADRNEWTEGLALRRHVSCLGWVLAPALLENQGLTGQVLHDRVAGGQLIGVELMHPPSEPPADWIQFIVCAEHQLSALVDISLPKLLVKRGVIPHGQNLKGAPGTGQLLGWIQESTGI